MDGGDNYNDIEPTQTIWVDIDTADVKNVTIAEIADQPYAQGSSITPALTLTLGEYPLVQNTDYTVAYTDNVNVGQATATVTGLGNFKGTNSKQFNIVNRTLTLGTDVTFDVGQNWATYFTTTEDLLLPENIAAYVVTGVNGSTVSVQRISKVMCEVPVLLQKYTTAPEAEINDEFEPSNSWRGTTAETTVSSLLESLVEGSTVYVLYNNAFVKTKSGKIPANRGILVLGEMAAAPRLTIDFGGDVTGVSQIDNGELKIENVYDLQGRKVAKPKKGLYISNGRKVAVK